MSHLDIFYDCIPSISKLLVGLTLVLPAKRFRVYAMSRNYACQWWKYSGQCTKCLWGCVGLRGRHICVKICGKIFKKFKNSLRSVTHFFRAPCVNIAQTGRKLDLRSTIARQLFRLHVIA